MTQVNRLYSALLKPYGAVASAKRTGNVDPGADCLNVIRAVMDPVPAARRADYAAVLCHCTLMSEWAAFILEADTANTYGFMPACQTISACLPGKAGIMACMALLDEDLADRAKTATFIDMAGAVGCHILRRL